MITLKSDNFYGYISSIPNCLVMVGSSRCKKCQEILKKIEITEPIGKTIEILYIDGYKWGEISLSLRVERYPTFIYYRQRQEISRIQSNNLNDIVKLWN